VSDSTAVADIRAFAPNFRSLSGTTLRPGSIYRSGELDRLSPSATKSLMALGVRTMYDMRTANEMTKASGVLGPGLTRIIVDVLADQPASAAAAIDDVIVGKSVVAGGGDPIATVNGLIGNGQSMRMMEDTYRDVVRMSSAREGYRTFLTGVAHSPHPVVFHCTAGKDRTGWAAAVIQWHLGVDDDTVMSDYLASNAVVPGRYQSMLDDFAARGGDAASMRIFLEVRPEFLEIALDTVRADFGNLDSYLRQGLGLRDTDLTALAGRLT
jgi:protein-tyrosine phosphatase